MGHQESFSKELGPIPIAEINQHWDDTVRGLTGVGMAVVANSTNGKIGSDAIDVGNLALNTGSFTYSNLYDHDYQQSSGFGLSTSIGIGGGSGGVGGAASNNSGQRATSPIINSNLDNPVQNSNFYPNGPTTISVSNSVYKKEQTTFATIGQGNITTGSSQSFDANGNLINSTGGTILAAHDSSLSGLNRDTNKTQVITKDTVTGALDVSVTVDNRLFTSEGRKQIGKEQDNLGKNLQTSIKAQAKLVDAPLTLLANSTANVPVLGSITTSIGGEGGSFATLATQLFGLNYLLDSGNSRLQNNQINQLSNADLKTIQENGYRISIEQPLGNNQEDGQGNHLIISDKDGEFLGRYQTSIILKDLNQISLNDILTNKDYSLHGIDNTTDQALVKGLSQFGQIQNQTTNPQTKETTLNFATLNAPTKGLIPDGIENIYNSFFGKTPIASANIIQLQDFSQTLGTVMQYQNITTQTGLNTHGLNTPTNQPIFNQSPLNLTGIRFAGHSNGGDRLYLGILKGASQLDFGIDQYNNQIKPFATIVGYDSEDKAIYQPNVAVQFWVSLHKR